MQMLQLFTSSAANHHNPIITPTETHRQSYLAKSASALPASHLLMKKCEGREM